MTRDRLLADLSRAVAECFPDRAEEIMRSLEREMRDRWSEEAYRLRQLVRRAGGPEKMSDGAVSIAIGYDGEWSVTAGTYSIGDWPRHTEVGRFGHAENALKAFVEMVDRAEAEVVEMERRRAQPVDEADAE